MALKDKFSAFMNGRRTGNGAVEGEPQKNILGEARGYRPGNTGTGMKPVAAPQQEAPTAQEAKTPAPGFGEMMPANSQPMNQQPVPNEGFTAALPYHNQANPQQQENTQLEKTGYHPLFRRNKPKKEQPAAYQRPPQPAAQPNSQQSAQMPPLQQGYQQSAQMPPYQQGYQQSAQMPPYQQGYQQSAQIPPFQQSYQQPVQGFQQSVKAQPFQQSAYQQPVQPQQQEQQRPAWGNGQGERGFNYTANHRRVDARPRRSTRTIERERQQQAQQSQQVPVANNVSYMNPNHFVDNGTAYAMVMRLAQPLNTARCYRLIEFMRNDEAVLVNTELIQDEAEASRCLDLLYGAAFAMNCVFTRVSARSIYLITPRSVEVLPYASMEGLAQRDNAARWPGSDPSNPQDPTWQYGGYNRGSAAPQPRAEASQRSYQEMRFY